MPTGMKKLTSKGQLKDGLDFQYPLNLLPLKPSELMRMTSPFLTNQVCFLSKHHRTTECSGLEGTSVGHL